MKIKKIPFDKNSQIIKLYKASLHGVIDDYVEGLIIKANHYLMFEDYELIGQIGILEDAVTFFYIFDDFKFKQAKYFLQFIRAKKIKYAYTSTADLDFFHTAIEYQKDVEMHTKSFIKTNAMSTAFDFDYIDYARLHDKEEIDYLTSSTFLDLHERIQDGQVYVLKEEGELIGVGVMRDCILFPKYVTLAAYTKEKHRRRGVASTLLEYMAEKIMKDHKKVVSGCYYYNEASSKMLSYSGFRLMNILCKIELK